MTYNKAEKEAIGLCIALEAINDMVNHELLGVNLSMCEVEAHFHTPIHLELFIIRLLDFVKEKGDCKFTGVSGSCIDILKAACGTCSFDQEDSIRYLRESVNKLDNWRKHKSTIKLWLPTLNIEANIEVSREELIYISANHSKHNLSRLTGVSKKIHSILRKKNYSMTVEQIPLALDDFREHLQEHYFIYYSTWLAELLNNIRWGIQSYLWPTFLKSFTKDNPNDRRHYRYKYPEEIQNEVPKQWFWRLMNNIRVKPYFHKFSVSHHFKKTISLERHD
jgi:hypothetical protein